MKQVASGRTPVSAKWLFLAFALAIALVTSAASDKKMVAARVQFERAVKLRTTLEATPQKDRTLADYRNAIAAYHRVYLITPQAEEVTPSLIAEAELYSEMGRLFDAKYYQSAIETYDFLIKEYPGSHYRGQALFSIGQIQKDGLNQPDVAEATFKDYLKRFPKSERSEQARAALKEIAFEREKAREQAVVAAAAAAYSLPELKGKAVDQRESDNGTPRVLDVKTWNGENAVRIIVTLEDTVAFNAARIASPDRIYVDMHRARITPDVAKKNLDVREGLLKSVRIAQNKDGIVRVVLDVDGARDYSTYLLANPYRLVIEVRNKPAAMSRKGWVTACDRRKHNDPGASGSSDSNCCFGREGRERKGFIEIRRQLENGGSYTAFGIKTNSRRPAFAHPRARAENQPHRHRCRPRWPRYRNDRPARLDGKRSLP